MTFPTETPWERLQRRAIQLFKKQPDERDIAPHLFPHRPPPITIGSIVLTTLFRTAFVMIASWIAIAYFRLDSYWWLPFFTLWLIAVYPAMRQYELYREVHHRLADDTLCARCKHYNPAGMVCSVYDEHVNKNYIPCQGEAWEPKHFDSE